MSDFKIKFCTRLDWKPRLLIVVWLGHCFKAVTLPYLLLIRRVRQCFSKLIIININEIKHFN
jgi:hypothetical protein